MKELKYIVYLVLAAFFAAACSKEEGLSEQPETDSGFDLVFAAQGEDLTLSRTTLQGPEALQHVSTVYLYIFEGTDTDTTCVAVEDVDWPYWENAQNGLNTLEYKYRVKYAAFDAEKEYTFVAVGLDNTKTASETKVDNSMKTYGFTLQANNPIGETLGALQVSAQTDTRTDIAQSEWFAGSLVLTGEQILTAKAETLNLYRRVAGVMGYFKDIPQGVEKLQICLYQPQNKEAWVLPQPTENGVFKDYFESPADGVDADTWKVLVEIQLPDNDDGTTDAGSSSQADSDSDSDAEKPAYDVKGGSYVLPARASTTAEETTLSLKLIGKGTTLTRKIYQQTSYAPVQAGLSRGETDEGTGIIGGDDDSQGPDDEEYKYHYPIIANHFYSIGTEDNPVSLADNGEIFVIINAGWDDEHNIVIKPSGN